MKKHLSLPIVTAVLSLVVTLAYGGSGPQWTCPTVANQTGCCTANTCADPPDISCAELSPIAYSTCTFTGNSSDNCNQVGRDCCSRKHFAGGGCNTTTGKCAGTPTGVTSKIQDSNGC